MGKKIKILFTIPNFDTAGSGKVVYDLVKGIDKNNFEPEICCFHTKGNFYEEVEKLGIKIHVFQFAQSYRPFWSLPFGVLKIYKFFKSNQFDIIHSWHWSSDFTEPLAAKWANIPYVYTKKAMGWGNKAWSRRSKLSRKVIAINKDMLETFFKGYGNKVCYMPLGVDLEYFKPLSKDYALKDKLSISEEDFVIISIANMVPVKGIEVLIEAVNALNDKTIKVLIIGNDNNAYGQHLKTTYESDNIAFLGKQQDVRPYLALANLFVIPTKNEGRKEGLPIAPLEAMASGCIVIGSNISGIKDILKPFPENLFEPLNVKELSEKIQTIKGFSNEEHEVLSNKMRAHVVETYSLKRCISNHEQLYKALVS